MSISLRLLLDFRFLVHFNKCVFHISYFFFARARVFSNLHGEQNKNTNWIALNLLILPSSKHQPETLQSELLFEDSGHSICCFCSSLNIFLKQFNQYCLMSINYFLRNGARSSQKRTFVRRQWAQYLLFLYFIQHLFQSI